MKTREFENALLLRDSGELSDAECRKLEEALTQNPALAVLAEENRVLLSAGPRSSAELVPPLPELNRERILNVAAQPQSKRLPRLLALAALLILGLGLLPHLTRYLQPALPVFTATIEPIRPNLNAGDPILNTLEILESELVLWSDVKMKDPAFLENENDWAKELMTQEDSI